MPPETTDNTIKKSATLTTPTTPKRPTTGSIAMVATAGKASPTCVADFPVDCRENGGTSRTKRIRGSIDDLLSEKMIYGDDLIKVWSIDEDDRGSCTPPVRLLPRKEASSNTNLAPTDLSKEQKQKQSLPVAPWELEVLPPQIAERRDVSSIEMDDLLWSLPSISMPPKYIFLPPRFSPPPSLSASAPARLSSNESIDSSELDNSCCISLGLDDLFETTTDTKPKVTRRKSHRRSTSYFDFNLAGSKDLS